MFTFNDLSLVSITSDVGAEAARIEVLINQWSSPSINYGLLSR